MALFDETVNRISIECVDNAHGFPGVVVYDDKTFHISSQQGTAFGAGHGPHSSVRTFQLPHYEDNEIAIECDPPETKSDSNASNGAPPLPLTDDDEVLMEVD